jgi:hypothetical protein
MEITINTMYGTFIVPSHKIQELVSWLKIHAIQSGGNTVREFQSGEVTNRQLINE